MKRMMGTMAAMLLVLALVSCGGPAPQGPSGQERPAWTQMEPDVEGDAMVFVGLSNPYATERGARDDALRNATQRVVQYLGTAAQSKFEQASTSFGLSSTVVDPTVATRDFQRQLSGNVARRLKPAEWYVEREETATGRAYVIFVRTLIPVSNINEAFSQTAKQNLADAQRRARDAVTDQAKAQADAAANFWSQMADQGLIPENQ